MGKKMKRIVLLFTILLLLTACGSKKKESSYDEDEVQQRINTLMDLSDNDALNENEINELFFYETMTFDASASLRYWLDDASTKAENPLILFVESNDDSLELISVIVYNDQEKYAYLRHSKMKEFSEESFVYEEDKIIYQSFDNFDIYLSKEYKDVLVASIR